MARVTVEPAQFSLVQYDAARIAEVVDALAGQLGFGGDDPVRVVVDERSPLGRIALQSADPLEIHLEGGAIEDPTAPRQLSERGLVDAAGRLLLRAADRRSGRFGDAPADGELTLQQATAWDATAAGRLARLGHDVPQPRRRYHFRSRHGFTDVADAVFDRLWGLAEPTWADIEAACAETEPARQPA